MRQYRITVNGNEYTVTVKSIDGRSALVDVDGLEFEVGLVESGESGVTRVVPPPAAAVDLADERQNTAAVVKPSSQTQPRKRASIVEKLSAKKSAGPDPGAPGLVCAHLPGLILEILVKPGDRVKEGDLVMKMEAMKMVNEVRAKTGGTVKEIYVKLHQNVLENQPLLLVEE